MEGEDGGGGLEGFGGVVGNMRSEVDFIREVVWRGD